MKLKTLAVGIALSMGASVLSFNAMAADDTIKVGVLHSLSGTMAISETTLKDTVLMMVEEQNKKGVCWVNNWKPWLLIRPLTGHCSRRKPVS